MSLELEKIQAVLSKVRTKLNQLETALIAKVSSADVTNMLTSLDDRIASIESSISSLELYYNKLNVGINKVLGENPNIVHVITYNAPLAEYTIAELEAEEIDTTTYTADFPRRVGVTFTNGVAGDYVVITGTDIYGTEIQETVLLGSNNTLNVFRTVTNINAENISDSVICTWSNWFGVNCTEFVRILQERVDGTIETHNAEDGSYGAIKFGTTPNGTRDYEVTIVI